MTSLLFDVSAISLFVKFVNDDSATNIAQVFSLMIMHAVFGSENCSLNEKPSLVKKSRVLARSCTGRLTKVPIDIVVSFLAVGCTSFQLPHIGQASR
jgi:hypothetical protein